MRLTELRELMRAQFGPVRAPSVASDHIFSALGGRSVDGAVAAGIDPKQIWAVVCEVFDVPESMWYGLPDDPDTPDGHR